VRGQGHWGKRRLTGRNRDNLRWTRRLSLYRLIRGVWLPQDYQRNKHLSQDL
jgi:hypothetical protein